MSNTFALLTSVFAFLATTKRHALLLHEILEPTLLRSSFASFNIWLAQLER